MRKERLFLLFVLVVLGSSMVLGSKHSYGLIDEIPSSWVIEKKLNGPVNSGEFPIKCSGGICGALQWESGSNIHTLYSTTLNKKKIYIGVGGGGSGAKYLTVTFDDNYEQIGLVVQSPSDLAITSDVKTIKLNFFFIIGGTTEREGNAKKYGSWTFEDLYVAGGKYNLYPRIQVIYNDHAIVCQKLGHIVFLGDGYWHKCLSATEAQGCDPKTGLPINKYVISKVKNSEHKESLQQICPRSYAATVPGSSSVCKYKSIAIIGASNTVKQNGNSFGELIEKSCPESKVYILAASGATPTKQKELQLPVALSLNPDLLIIDPSANGITDIAYYNSVKAMTVAAKASDSNMQVVVMTISPHKNYDYGGGAQWNQKIQNEIEIFNDDLVLHKLSTENINQAVNTYPTLGSPSDKDVCGFCKSDLGHLNAEGHKRVAAQILKEVFGLIVDISSWAGGGSGGIQVGTASAAQQIQQNCQIEQRCKDIDSAWVTFSGVLGLRSGEVWVPPLKAWRTFADVYNPKAVAAPAAVSSPGSGKSGAGIVECATADASMTNEQKAFLDTIAYAEGTTNCGIKHGVSSYNILVGCTVFTDLSNHPNSLVSTGDVKSKAAGRYQNLHVSQFGPGKKYPDFQPATQDRAALDLATSEGSISQSSFALSPNWEVIWNSAAKTWAAISYTQTISPDSNWHKNNKKVNGGVVDSSCGNGNSYYCQGSGVNHATLTKVYNLCLKNYQSGGAKGTRFKLSSGEKIS
ncbi:hypothetical protein HY495_00770 [Candidatus Woesearchaeota archaeon]|nr:hypothetical protein [Candidatus Woesearchaeota archaeon]